MEKIKVLIADDHRVVREGLAAILKTKEDIHVVGEAQDGAEAVENQNAHAGCDSDGLVCPAWEASKPRGRSSENFPIWGLSL